MVNELNESVKKKFAQGIYIYECKMDNHPNQDKASFEEFIKLVADGNCVNEVKGSSNIGEFIWKNV